jgi:hypothetical protein
VLYYLIPVRKGMEGLAQTSGVRLWPTGNPWEKKTGT